MMFLLPENVTAWLCPKTPPAMPADVRKAFGLPARLSSRFWATPNLLGRSPKIIVSRNGSAERFRTSGGRAAGMNQSLGKAHHHCSPFAFALCSSLFALSNLPVTIAPALIICTAAIAQLVRAPDCGSGGRGFEPH